MKKLTTYVWGIFLLVFGVILLGNYTGIIDFNIFIDGWWTFFIIIPSFIGLFDRKNFSTSLIFLIVGVLLFLEQIEAIGDINIFMVIVALLIIRVGAHLLFKKKPEKFKVPSKTSSVSPIVAVFSGKEEVFTSSISDLPDIVAIFGGAEIDLTNAAFNSDIYLSATAIFGGIDIKIGDNINVVTNGVGIFGGIENRNVNSTDNRYTLYISNTCVFGGIDIK